MATGNSYYSRIVFGSALPPGKDRRACVVRPCGMRLPGWNVGKYVSVRGGMTRDVDVDVDGDDDEDRAGGKLFSDSSDDDNESYTGVTHCLRGISSRGTRRC